MYELRTKAKILTDSDTGTEAKFNGLTLGDATSLAASDEASCTMGSHVSARDWGWEGGVSGGVALFKVPPVGWSTAKGSSARHNIIISCYNVLVCTMMHHYNAYNSYAINKIKRHSFNSYCNSLSAG